MDCFECRLFSRFSGIRMALFILLVHAMGVVKIPCGVAEDSSIWSRYTLVVRGPEARSPNRSVVSPRGSGQLEILRPSSVSYLWRPTLTTKSWVPVGQGGHLRGGAEGSVSDATKDQGFGTPVPLTTVRSPVAGSKRMGPSRKQYESAEVDDEDEEDEEDEEEEDEEEDTEDEDVDRIVIEEESVDEPHSVLKKRLKKKFKKPGKGGFKLKDLKKLKKFMLPLLLAYKLKFFTLIPLLMGGLVLMVASTGFAGFFFALFAVGLGLKKHR